MQRRTYIKNCLFRSIAVLLLAVSVGSVLLPESNLYSADKTFVKSHTPTADNFAMLLSADDKEDSNEDGAIDIQLSPDWLTEFISLVAFQDGGKAKIRVITKTCDHHVYLFHRQLLI